MERKGFYLLFFVVLITLLHNINALPRDKIAAIVPELQSTNFQETKRSQSIVPAAPVILGRLQCAHEEATEDASCQEHCLPKGYSYGICVSGTCSCI